MIHHVAKIREDAVEIDKWGRIVIPVKLRRALSIEPGEHVVLRLKNGTITLSKSAKETRELAREWAETAESSGSKSARKSRRKTGSGLVSNMPEGSLDFSEGVIDVGVLLPSVFDNPPKEMKLYRVCAIRRKACVLPISSVIRAYHNATRYLKIPRVPARKILGSILLSGSVSLYQDVDVEVANDGLDYSSTYGI